MKKIIKKLFVLSLAVVLLIGASLSLFSCDKTPSESESESETVAQTQPQKEITEITVCAEASYAGLIEYIGSLYTSYNPYFVVKVVTVEEYKLENNKIDSSFFTEGGPDILFITNGVNIDLPDLVQNGSLADINKVAEDVGYDYFKPEALNAEALKTGNFGGKQLLLPLFYSIPLLSYIPEYIEDEKIVIDGSFAEFVESAKDYSGALFSQCPTLADIYCYLGLDLIDLNSGKYDLNTPEMAELVELYSTLYSDYANDPSKYKAPTGSYLDSYELTALSAQDILFLNGVGKDGSAINIDLLDSLIYYMPSHYLSFDMTAFPGSLNDGSTRGTVGWCVAVNSKATKKTPIVGFLDMLTNYDATALYWSSVGIGTYELFNENAKDKLYGREPTFGDDVFFDQFVHDLSTNLPTESLDNYYKVFDATDSFIYLDYTTTKIINSIIEDVQKNGLSVEDALISASDRLAIYFNLK